MEYIPNGDLLNAITKKTLSKKEKKSIMREILQALAYIHNRRPYSLIHRDIKPTNILLTNSKVAKITDFGLSKFSIQNRINSNNNLNELDQISENDQLNSQNSQNNQNAELHEFVINNELTNNYANQINMKNSNNHSFVLLQNLNDVTDLTENVGTERYMAPEVFNTQNYTNKADIYSCGILLYEMFENKRYNPKEKLSWYYTPQKIRNIIINHMVKKNPESRLSALEILHKLNILNIK